MADTKLRRALRALRRRFSYRRDGRFDLWRFLAPRGPVEGDCEDFALTLARDLAGGAWWRFWWHQVTFRSVIWYVITDRGEGHAALWHRGAGWACNIYPRWQPLRHSRRFPYVLPLLILKLMAARLYLCLVGTIKRAKPFFVTRED